MPAAVSAYDLHSHSTYSDGVMRPAEVVARAAARGVRVLALTDHDELAGLPEARAAAVAVGIELVSGVEVSTTWRGHTIHVLGLRVDADNSVLRDGLHSNRAGRAGRAERIAAALATVGVHGALEGARAYVTNPELVSRTHFARYLVAHGHARDMQSVFDRYLGTGKPGYVAHDWAGLTDAVGWITVAEGLPVLAHPGRYALSEGEREALLREFKTAGGVAIEVVSGSHKPDEYAYWARCAARHGFAASMGSDFHGPPENHRDIGGLPSLPSGCIPVWTRF